MFMSWCINSTVTYPSWGHYVLLKSSHKTHLEKEKALYNNHESVINKTLSHRVVPKPDWFSSGKAKVVYTDFYLYSPLHLLV